MKVFISHAFGEDSYLYGAIKSYLDANGFKTWDSTELGKRLSCVSTGGNDYYELKDAFYRAGYSMPRGFEKSDPQMLCHLVSEIGNQDAIVVLWSKHHAFRYWTTIERTIAVAMCKPVVFVLIDDEPFPEDLSRAINNNTIPKITLDDYLSQPHILSYTLYNLAESKMIEPIVHEVILDSSTGVEFVLLKNTIFGEWEFSRYPITNIQVERLWPDHVNRRCPCSSADEEPAVLINWEEAHQLCCRLSLDSDTHDYRLPTEVEWEFAARAGNSTYYGFEFSGLYFNRTRTAPVGTLQQNKWGVCDCVGNVAQWTSNRSRWSEYNGWYKPVRPISIDGRISDYHNLKGSFFGTRIKVSLSASFASPSFLHEEVVGIRLVREIKRSR